MTDDTQTKKIPSQLKPGDEVSLPFDTMPDLEITDGKRKPFVSYDIDHYLINEVVIVHNSDVTSGKCAFTQIRLDPEVNYLIRELKKFYGFDSWKTFLSTLASGAWREFQHKYNDDLKLLSKESTELFFNDFKRGAEKYSRFFHLFEKMPAQTKKSDDERIVRARKKVFADLNNVIAPIGEAAEYFNMSGSDLIQLSMLMLISTWKDLPVEPKALIDEKVKAFDVHLAKHKKN
jgi:hypothetical protein